MSSQHTCVHRILHLDDDDDHERSLLVSELSKSQALQIFRKGLPPLERYPMKTFKVTTRKARSLAPTAPNLRYELHRTSRCSRGQVYDATEPCPRSGNPLCHCTGDMGATIPAENIWADPRAEEVYDPQITPSITELTPVTDPRTGEAQLLHVFSQGTRADSAFSKFWSFGVKGFRSEARGRPHASGCAQAGLMPPPTVASQEVPAASMYSTNGAPGAAADAQPGRLGASTEVLRYKPSYLRRLLKREPWRRAQLLDELHAAGVVDETGRFVDESSKGANPS